MKSFICQYGERSEHQDLLAAGLHEFQLKLASVERNAEGAYGEYSDLDAVTSAIRSAVPGTGLSFSQFPHDTGEGKVVLETTVLHSSGQFRTGYKTIFISGMDSAEQGGDVGYWSRICLMKMFGIASKSVTSGTDHEGDDGKPGRGKFRPSELTGKAKQQYMQVIEKLSVLDSNDLEQAAKGKEIVQWVVSQQDKGTWNAAMVESITTEFPSLLGGNNVD
jgi:hypothetical protein